MERWRIQEDPKCLTDAEALVVKQLRLLVGSGVLGFTFFRHVLSSGVRAIGCEEGKRRFPGLSSSLVQASGAAFRPGHEGLSFDAVQVTLFWPFHGPLGAQSCGTGTGAGF